MSKYSKNLTKEQYDELLRFFLTVKHFHVGNGYAGYIFTLREYYLPKNYRSIEFFLYLSIYVIRVKRNIFSEPIDLEEFISLLPKGAREKIIFNLDLFI